MNHKIEKTIGVCEDGLINVEIEKRDDNIFTMSANILEPINIANVDYDEIKEDILDRVDDIFCSFEPSEIVSFVKDIENDVFDITELLEWYCCDFSFNMDIYYNKENDIYFNYVMVGQVDIMEEYPNAKIYFDEFFKTLYFVWKNYHLKILPSKYEYIYDEFDRFIDHSEFKMDLIREYEKINDVKILNEDVIV